MRFLDLTLPSLCENLALDEAFLLEAESGRGGEVLRFWEWREYAVVLGAAGVIADDVDEDHCRADGVPLARRSSGGGTVLLGPGCLLISLILSFDRAAELSQIGPSYRYILGRVRTAFADCYPGIALEGISDLTLEGRKFSGNSQQRKRHFLLHHGTVLYGFNLGALTRYLKPPPRQPDYRHHRPHGDFVRNLPLAAGDLRGRLRGVWASGTEGKDYPAELVGELVREKYQREAWVRRR